MGNMMSIRYAKYTLFVLLAAVFIAPQTLAQVEEPPTNIAIIMDASGSMQALLEGGRSRIAIARDEIIALSSELSPSVNASLWVYGHRLSQDDPAASCLDIEEVIPLGAIDAAAFASAVSSVNAIGYTPIADTLGIAYSSLPASERDIIVLMSDGEESCGGDPCEVAAELDERNIDLRIHTIGYAADAGTRAQLRCIAEVTGGNYFEARDTEALRQALLAATTSVTGQIAVVRSDGEIATGVGFTVVDSTGTAVGSVVGSGSFVPGDYVVTVNTEPPLEANVTVVAGETVTINLPELGAVRIVNAAGEVQEQFPLTAFAPATNDIVGFGAAGAIQLPAGRYDIAVGDMSDQWATVTLAAGETVDIVVDFGAIQLVDANGNPTDAYPFYIFDVGGVEVFETVNMGFTNLPAGSYDVEVRTDPRLRQTVSVNAGETTTVMLPEIGTLQLVNTSGTPIGDYSFHVFPEGGNAQTIFASGGAVNLIAGSYDVEVQTDPPTRETVVIMPDQISQIVLSVIGTVQLVDAEGNPTAEYPFWVYPAGSDNPVHLVRGGSVDLTEGSYDVEVLSNPRLRQTITVTANEITIIQIGDTGMLPIEGEWTLTFLTGECRGAPVTRTLSVEGDNLCFDDGCTEPTEPGVYIFHLSETDDTGTATYRVVSPERIEVELFVDMVPPLECTGEMILGGGE
jgi:hypothetical protein